MLLSGGNRRHGSWVEVEEEEVREDSAIICQAGWEKKVVAPEDVRTIPSDTLSATAARASYGCQTQSTMM